MIKKIFAILMIFCILFLSGCVEYSSSEEEGAEIVQEDASNTSEMQDSVDVDNAYTNATEPKTVIVYLENYKFDPYLVTISAGDTVKWVKKDHPAQIIKSNVFQSQTMRDGDTFSFTFEEPGNYDYQIVTHPWTPGGIVVVE